MTTLDHADATSRITARPALLARAFNAVMHLYRVWRHRRDFYKLGEMSDNELADIGLVRTDLLVAIDLPFAADPTSRLNGIRQRRSDLVMERARKVC